MDEEKSTQNSNEDILAEVLEENKTEKLVESDDENSTYSTDDNESEKNSGIKKPIILTIVALVAASALTFCAVWFSPSRVMTRAINKTLLTVAQRPSVTGTIFGNSSALLDENKLALTLAGTINQNTVSDKFNGIGGKLTAGFDGENKLANAKISATYQGAELLNADVYTDDDIILFAMPAVMDNVLQFNCENILSQYASSELCTDKDSIDTSNDISVKIFGDEGDDGQIDAGSMLKLKSLVSDSWNNEFVGIKNNISVTRDGSKSINIDGEDKNCRGYRMTIAGDDIKSLILGTVKDVYCDETFKAYLKTSCAAVYNNNSMYQLFIGSEDEFYNLVTTRVDSIIASVDTYMDFDDLSITMFVYDGYIANAVAASAISVGSDKVGFDFNFDYANKEEINSNLNVTSSEGTVVYTYNDKAIENNGTIENSIELSKKDTNSTEKINLVLNLNKTSGETDADVSILSDDDEILDLSANGTIVSDSNGISAQLDEVSLNQYEDSLEMSAEFELSKLEEPIEPLEGNIIKLFEDDPETVKSELQSAKEKIDSLLLKVSSRLNTDN